MADYVEVLINYIPGAEASYSSDDSNEAANLGALQNFKSEAGFKGMWLNGREGNDPKRSNPDYPQGSQLDGTCKLFPSKPNNENIAEYPGWVGNELSSDTIDGTGYPFPTPQVLTITSTSQIMYLSILFDTKCQEYATEWRFSTDPTTLRRRGTGRLEVHFIENQPTTVQLIIYKWSHGRQLAKVARFTVGYAATYGPKQLISCQVKINQGLEAGEISAGFFGYTARLAIMGGFGEFAELQQKGLIDKGIQVTATRVEVGNPSNTRTFFDGELESWENDFVGAVAKLEVLDRVLLLQKRNYPGRAYSETAIDVVQLMREIFGIIGWSENVDYVLEDQAELSRTTMQNFWILPSNVYDVVDAVAKAGNMTVLQEVDGLIHVREAS